MRKEQVRLRRLPWAALSLGAVLLVLPILSGLATGEVVQRGHLRVSFEGRLTPVALPRSKSIPVSVAVGGKIATVGKGGPPQLRLISISINRYGRLDPGALPVCRIEQIQPSTTAGALEACGRSLVGEGRFSADVLLPEQAPFPSVGKIYAFNGAYRGRPAILAHVYGTRPVPTSYTLPFKIGSAKGMFGTVLTASLPRVTSQWGHITALSLELDRSLSASTGSPYLAARCPAPGNFPGAVFSLARTSFSFAGGPTLSATLRRNCRVRG